MSVVAACPGLLWTLTPSKTVRRAIAISNQIHSELLRQREFLLPDDPLALAFQWDADRMICEWIILIQRNQRLLMKTNKKSPNLIRLAIVSWMGWNDARPDCCRRRCRLRLVVVTVNDFAVTRLNSISSPPIAVRIVSSMSNPRWWMARTARTKHWIFNYYSRNRKNVELRFQNRWSW